MTEPALDPQTKVCPQCAEEVRAAALICRFCRYEFEPLHEPAPSATPVPQSTQPAATSSGTPDGSVPRSRADLAVELAQATQQWTLPRLLGKFDATRAGLGEIGDTEAVMREHGYEPGSPVHDEHGRTHITYTRRPASTAGAVQPTPAVGRSTSKTPILVLALVFALAVIGVGAFLVIKQSSVSDAASVWCTGNGDAVIAAGRRLGVFPPDALPVRIGNSSFTVKGLRSTGVSIADIDKVLSGGSSVISDWQTADSGSFARACNAAFDAR